MVSCSQQSRHPVGLTVRLRSDEQRADDAPRAPRLADDVGIRETYPQPSRATRRRSQFRFGASPLCQGPPARRGASRLRRLAGCVAHLARITIQPRSIERLAVIGRTRKTRSLFPDPGSAAIAAAEQRGGGRPLGRSVAPPQRRQSTANGVVPFNTFLVSDEYEQNLGRIGQDYR